MMLLNKMDSRVNKHGAFLEYDDVVAFGSAVQKWNEASARIMLVRRMDGRWVSGHHLQSPSGAGSGGLPSINRSQTFPDRESALLYEIAYTIDYFEGQLKSSFVGDTGRRKVRQILEELKVIA